MVALSLPLLPFLDDAEPLELSQGVIRLLGTRIRVIGRERIPRGVPLVIVSNHRSPLDAPILMTALHRDIAFVCHQYMANVPVLRDVVERFGAFPLDTPRRFFEEGCQRLRRQEALGIFPEGAKPMVSLQPPNSVNPFHRGFAHLALRVPVDPLALLPVGLASNEPGFESPIPLKLLGWFDPSEPLFQRSGGHPLVFYREVEVRIGEPIWITPHDRQAYQGRQGSDRAQKLTDACWTAVHQLVHYQPCREPHP